jgi:hypothetical protein
MHNSDELSPSNLTSIADKSSLQCVEKYENYEETEKWLLGKLFVGILVEKLESFDEFGEFLLKTMKFSTFILKHTNFAIFVANFLKKPQNFMF